MLFPLFYGTFCYNIGWFVMYIFQEILVPVYKLMENAFNKHQDVSVFITFASLRSVYETVREALNFSQIRVIAVIAEGMPENQTRQLIKAWF